MATSVTDPAALVDAGPCGWCADGQWDHRQGKKGCKVPGCGCGKYEPPKDRPAPAAVFKVDPASEVPGELVDGPSVPGPGVCVGEPEPAQPGDVDLPIDTDPETCCPGEPVPGYDPRGLHSMDCPAYLAMLERSVEARHGRPEPEPVVVVADPAAQAEHAEQVAAVDAQLADPDRAEPPAAADMPMPPADFLAAVTMVGERAAAGYGWQHGYLAGQAAAAAELAAAQREANEALNRAGHHRAKRDEERRRADRLDAALRDVTAELEQVRTDKIRLAGQLAPRLADLDQALAEVSRLRHTNVELGRARADIDRLRRERDDAQAALKNTADAYVHTSIAAATKVLYRYDAYQCTTEGCGSRYTVPTEHPHPLTPVTVLVVRREHGVAQIHQARADALAEQHKEQHG